MLLRLKNSYASMSQLAQHQGRTANNLANTAPSSAQAPCKATSSSCSPMTAISTTDRSPIAHAETLAHYEIEQRNSRTPEEAAKQVEEILMRQFVDELTKGLFERGVMTDILARFLVDAGTLKLSDHLLRQWGRQEASPELLDTPVNPPKDERLS